MSVIYTRMVEKLNNENIRRYIILYMRDPGLLPEALRDISNWDVSEVTNMRELFARFSEFNRPLNWDTRNVTDMSFMFGMCKNFNQPVNFDTRNVTNMEGMFTDCENFNQPVNFDTRNVTKMSFMFARCKNFNQPVNFDTPRNVISMSYMFID